MTGSGDRAPCVVVATDFSPAAEAAWAVARRLAHALGARLILAHVFVEATLYGERPFAGDRVRAVYAAARQWVEQALERWAAGARAEGLEVETRIRTGVPHREIVALAAEAQAELVVMGTRGRGGLERTLLGSVADRVIRLAPCPVLTVREAEAA